MSRLPLFYRRAQRGGGGDQNGRHDDLRQNGAEEGVEARRAQIGHAQLLLDHRALLEKHHPGHDDRADIGRDQVEIFGIAEGNIDRLRRDRDGVGAREDRHHDEHQFEGADANGDAFDAQIGMGIGHQQQGRGDQEHGERRGQAHQGADAGKPGQFREQRAGAADQQGQDRKPGPETSEMFFNELRMALAGDQSEPNGQLLDDIKDGNERQLQPEQAIAPDGAALRRGDDAARVGVGEHDHEARPRDRKEISQPCPARRCYAQLGHTPTPSKKVMRALLAPTAATGAREGRSLDAF